MHVTNTQEKGASKGYAASHPPSGMTTQGGPHTAPTLFLKIFSTSLFRESTRKTDFEIYAHAKFSNSMHAYRRKHKNTLINQ